MPLRRSAMNMLRTRLLSATGICLLLLLSGSTERGMRSAAAATASSIAGRVNNFEGNPLAGVTITATPVIGSIRVLDEAGQPVDGAQVFRNDSLSGATGADGRL